MNNPKKKMTPKACVTVTDSEKNETNADAVNWWNYNTICIGLKDGCTNKEITHFPS